MSDKPHTDADPWTDLNLDDPELQQLLDEPLKLEKSVLRNDEQSAGFDNNVGDSWIYPSNMPMRDYQYNITQAALYRNTLVVLPTGLGKTFIAAVVMYNFYRWYPRGKVIFMAPTRPLVAQQIEACQKIMPFPHEDTAELTGRLNKKTRSELWQSKRVFFVTPQVVQSDIANAGDADVSLSFPAEQVKLLVVDEAHKAKGRYAYTEVAQALWQRNRYFRMLALTATPGRTMEDVAAVIRNLFISHLEVRCDNSIDVSSYVHKRNMSTVVVPLSAEIEDIRDELLLIIDPYLRQLIEADVLSGSLTNISRNFLLYEQKRFRERSTQQRHRQQSTVTTNFSVCISLYHSLELLERHGTRVFLNSFEQDEDGRAKFVVAMDRRLRNLVERVRREVVGPNPLEYSTHAMTNGEIAEIPTDLDFGHPKFEKARSCLLEHFQTNPDSRAIVFCEYRESVMLVYRLLLQHRPLMKPRCFVGQGGNTGFLRALTQKQQIQIMSDFRAGVSNILVATCIGEEGIDVGEVDLIVCFDISTTNPTRFVQRIGRTGRQRQGAVVMLVTAGKEQAQLKEVLANKDQTNKKLSRSSVVAAALYKHSPRMVPTVFNPQCLKTYVRPPQKEPDLKKSKKTTATTSNQHKNKKPPSANQDLRNFFMSQQKNVAADSMHFDGFPDGSQKSSQAPGLVTQRTIEKSINKVSKHFKGLDLSNIAPAVTQTQYIQNVATAEASPTISISDNDSDFECAETQKEINARLRRLEKFLSTDYADPSEKLVPLSREQLLKELKSSKPLKVTKRIALKMNVEFVREIYEKMKILQAVEDEEEEEEEEGDHTRALLTDEELEIRAVYQLMVDTFEGREELEKFLEKVELETFKQKCDLPDEILLADDDDEDEEFRERLDEAFKGVKELGLYNDNWDYIVEEYKKTSHYQEVMAKSDRGMELAGGESMVFETMRCSSEDVSLQMEDDSLNKEDFSATESRYCNQWEELAEAQKSPRRISTSMQRSTAHACNEIVTIDEVSLQTIEEIFNDPKIMQQSESMEIDLLTDTDENVLMEPPQESKLLETELKSYTQWEEFVRQQNIKENSTPVQRIECSVAKQKKSEETILETIIETTEDHHNTRTAMEKTNCSSNESKICSQWEEFLKSNLRHNSTPVQGSSSRKNPMNQMKATARSLLNVINFFDTNRNQSMDNPNFHNNPKTEPHQKTADENYSQSSKDSLKPENKTNHDRDDDDNADDGSTPEVLQTSVLASAEFTAAMQNDDDDIASHIDGQMKNDNESKIAETMLHNLDMDAFLEPFPEECLLKVGEVGAADVIESSTANCIKGSCEEYKTKQNEANARKPRQPQTKSAAIVKCLTACEANNNPQNMETPQTPAKCASQLVAPTNGNDKSPSIFDIYLRNLRQLTRQRQTKQNLTATNSASLASAATKDAAASDDETSVVVLNRRKPSSKRKIFDSDSENEDARETEKLEKEIVIVDESSTSSEEIQATQHQQHTPKCKKRRRRHHAAYLFLEREAAISGGDSEGSADECRTLGQDEYDSIVVANDAEEEDNASRSHMQAMYLQSVKSPVQRCGAFKIPDFRVYNDQAEIFSQAVPVESSQYVNDSFIVDETDAVNDIEASLCPLERAERILKKQKRSSHRRYAPIAGITKRKQRKRICPPADSSEEE